MTSFSRRFFLNRFATASSLAVFPAMNVLWQEPFAQALEKVMFEIKFSGPFAFVSDAKKDYIRVYAPKTTHKHFPVVYNDLGEKSLVDGINYSLAGVSATKASRPPVNPPVEFAVNSPYDYADRHCRLAITIPRPDLVKGINLAGICIDKRAKGAKPTGLRFIYYNYPTTSKPTVQKAGSEYFSATFDATDPKWELNIRMVPESVVDPGHKTARQSFQEIMELCSVRSKPALSYGGDDDGQCPQTEFLRGPGSDCQVVSVWINT